MDDDTSRDATECKEIKLDSPSVNRTIKSLPSRQSGIDKALAAMAKPIALESVMQAFSSQQAVIDNAVNESDVFPKVADFCAVITPSDAMRSLSLPFVSNKVTPVD